MQEKRSDMCSLRSWLLISVALLWIPTPTLAQDLTQVFRKVSPSVVVVRARGQEITDSGQTHFRETGSGVLISPDGKVMTTAQLVHSMDEITVEFPGSETVSARVVASEPAADLSLLQLDHVPPGALAATLADSDRIDVGAPIIVLGGPRDPSYVPSAGLISARWAPNTVDKTMPLAEFLQIDATVDTENSGGPMFNMAGEVIGIVSQNFSRAGTSERLGFAVTVNTAKQLLLAKKSFSRGIEGGILSDDRTGLRNLFPHGASDFVRSVVKDSPAPTAELGARAESATTDRQPVALGGATLFTVEGIPAGLVTSVAKIRDLLPSLKPSAFSRTP